jgi:ParB/RepB/Spo0J family partition protein
MSDDTVTIRRSADADETTSHASVREIAVAGIRPEAGLGRKRDRSGHEELQRSIARFGVLTPITVRHAPDGSHQFLLIKGQGRTLACQILGIEMIPALVVDDAYAEREKVQQFLVENVARLKMRPVDRALLIKRARESGEETTAIAERFGLSPATVRRLLTQMEGAGSREVAALQTGRVNLSVHAIVARRIAADERGQVLGLIADTPVGASDLQMLLSAIGWEHLEALGKKHVGARMRLLGWGMEVMQRSTKQSARERIVELAAALPTELPHARKNPAPDRANAVA